MADGRHAQIRVLIADGQPLFLTGLAVVIRRDRSLRLVAELDDEAAVLDGIRRFSPDVALLDAGFRALALIESVAQHGFATRVALLAGDVRRDDVLAAVAAGAHGYLSKQATGDIVCEAVRRLAAGKPALCDEAQAVVTGEIRLRHRPERRLLTRREFDVLRLMAEGHDNAEIGRRLNIAPATVKSYSAQMYERLGVRDRLGAVVEAMRRGLLT